jgi:deoxyadenosine/deoxycytidine kinase
VTAVRFIAVAGNMGAGKSTLVEFLERRFKVRPFYEPNESNPYLADFYGDMPRWAFQSQAYFLTAKFRIHQQIHKCLADDGGTFVQDRTIYEDAEVFAENLYRSRVLPERDYQTYRALYETIVESLPPPDLLIYLRCSVRAVRHRIRLRGRPEEQEVPLAYVRRLHQLYEEWFARYDHSPTLVIDSDRLDYVTDLVHRIDLTRTIERFIA